MASVAYRTQVPLSTLTPNILAGGPLANAPRNGVVTILGTHYDAGAGVLILHAYRGTDYAVQGVGIQKTASGPNRRDNVLAQFGVEQGDAIIVHLQETAGVATNPNIVVEFQAV